MNDEFYIVTDSGMTFHRYRTFLEEHAKLLIPYWKDGEVANENHRYYLRGVYPHSSSSSREVAILQDIQTKQVVLVNRSYVIREE